MSGSIRNTRKSRLIAEFSEAVVDLVLEGVQAPSKGEIVERVVASNIVGTSSAIRSVVTDEMANELERYFSEVCKSAGQAMGDVDYHLVTSAFYKRKRPVPQSYEEARQYVCVFGNGRTGKAAGVRFPTEQDQPDAMLLVATEKSIDVINKAIETHMQKTKAMINSPMLTEAQRFSLVGSSPNQLM